MSYSSLFIFLFHLFRGFVVVYLFPNCTSLSPAVFRTSYVSTLWPFAFTTIARSSLPQPHTNTLVYSTYNAVPLSPFYLHSSHIPHSHNHSIYNTIQSFPFTGTHTTTPLSSLFPSTPASNSLHLPHWDYPPCTFTPPSWKRGEQLKTRFHLGRVKVALQAGYTGIPISVINNEFRLFAPRSFVNEKTSSFQDNKSVNTPKMSLKKDYFQNL